MKNTTTTDAMNTTQILLASRGFSNESRGRDMHGCIASGDRIECFFPNAASFSRNAALFSAAPEMLAALEQFAQCSQVRDIICGDTELARSVLAARHAIAKAKRAL